MRNTIFNEVAELSELKYFVKNIDNKLELKKDIFSKIFHINKIIDFHTHLGWNYLLSEPVNLQAKNETRHFFPEENESIDLSRYSAYDFDKEQRLKCRKETIHGVYSNKGFSSTHTIPNLINEMNRYLVEKAIVLAIDYPKFSQNSDHILKEVKDNKHLVPFISIHPLTKNKEILLQNYLSNGAKGIKIHTPMQLAKPNHKGYYEIYELCKKYKLPILFHTGYSPLSPKILRRFTKPKDFQEVIKDFPEVTFIIGHSGGSDTYLQMAEIARYNENVYLEIDGQPPKNLELIFNMTDANRILYGTDWPYYPMGMQLAKVLIATEKKPFLRKRVLYKNAKTLLKQLEKYE